MGQKKQGLKRKGLAVVEADGETALCGQKKGALKMMPTDVQVELVIGVMVRIGRAFKLQVVDSGGFSGGTLSAGEGYTMTTCIEQHREQMILSAAEDAVWA